MIKLIKSGTLITDTHTFVADILIDGEQIAQVGQSLHYPGAEEIHAAGKLILPGGVDPHTHFELPMFGTVSSDDHYTGHKAAAFGGTTTVIDFVSQDFPTLHESVVAWHAKADSKAAIDFSFHMNITHFDQQISKQIPDLIDLGITSLKVFSAYNGRLRLQDSEIFQVLRLARSNGLLTMLHAENGDVIDILIAEALRAGHKTPEWHAATRPNWSAVEATLRGAALAAQADAPIYIVHMNAGGEVDQLQYARQHGVQAMGETCPQYLFFTEEHLRQPDGAKWICSPPMRTLADNDRLWQGLADGVIQVIGTDHCPFFFDGTQSILYEGKPVSIPGKELGKDDFTKIPNGLPAVGDRLPILWTYGVKTGRISANQFVALTSANPARIFGLYPKKGCLEPGSDADLVIWDPGKHITYGVGYEQHRTDYNLFEGWELYGFPEQVFLRGNLIVDRGKWLGKSGMGRYLYRQPHSQVL
jgi:dihydropyrimidinase